MTNKDIAGDHQWCIAGGYAACPALAQDMDVWVFGDKDTRAEILDRLNGCGVGYDAEENDPAIPQAFYDLGSGVLCWKVAKLVDGRHIIVTNAQDVYQLLAIFDVSTHQIAIMDGVVCWGEHHTALTVPPVAIRNGTTTPARMEKITARYARFVQEAA